MLALNALVLNSCALSTLKIMNFSINEILIERNSFVVIPSVKLRNYVMGWRGLKLAKICKTLRNRVLTFSFIINSSITLKMLLLESSLKTLSSFEFFRTFDAVLSDLPNLTIDDGFNTRIFFYLYFEIEPCLFENIARQSCAFCNRAPRS